MSIANIVSLYAMPSSVGYIHYTASQGLMNLLKSNKIRPLDGSKQYIPGSKLFFKNNGSCTISFLPDGRLHVLDAPMAMWSLHDMLSAEELHILIAFCAMDEANQQAMREALAPFCESYFDIMPRLAKINTTWKHNFLNHYKAVEVL